MCYALAGVPECDCYIGCSRVEKFVVKSFPRDTATAAHSVELRLYVGLFTSLENRLMEL